MTCVLKIQGVKPVVNDQLFERRGQFENTISLHYAVGRHRVDNKSFSLCFNSEAALK